MSNALGMPSFKSRSEKSNICILNISYDCLSIRMNYNPASYNCNEKSSDTKLLDHGLLVPLNHNNEDFTISKDSFVRQPAYN